DHQRTVARLDADEPPVASHAADATRPAGRVEDPLDVDRAAADVDRPAAAPGERGPDGLHVRADVEGDALCALEVECAALEAASVEPLLPERSMRPRSVRLNPGIPGRPSMPPGAAAIVMMPRPPAALSRPVRWTLPATMVTMCGPAAISPLRVTSRLPKFSTQT